MSAHDFEAWAEEVGDPTVPLSVVSDVSTVRVGDRMMVIVDVPIPVGLDPDWMREALRESVARAGSAGRRCRLRDPGDLLQAD